MKIRIRLYSEGEITEIEHDKVLKVIYGSDWLELYYANLSKLSYPTKIIVAVMEEKEM